MVCARPRSRGDRSVAARSPHRSSRFAHTLRRAWAVCALLSLPAAASAATPNGVLLDFSAKWCGPCQTMNPIVHRLQRQGYAIREVDIDQERELAERFGVTSIPTFVLIVNNQEVRRIVGPTSEDQLRRLAMQIPPVSNSGEQIAQAPANRAPQSFPPTVVEPKAPAAQQPAATPPARIVEVAQSSEPRFQIPFFQRKKEVAQAPAADPTVRANYEEDSPAAAEHPPADPMGASTRIRIKCGKWTNYGSGTVVASLPGRSLVLTCGHVFRGYDQQSQIEVDVFTGSRFETYVGTPVDYDMASDVGMIAIPTAAVLPACPIAGPVAKPAQGDTVTSIGCGGGEAPTQQTHRVTALNRYLGPDTIECTGMPMEGRSGGGLFNIKGEVIGVCNTADHREQRGLYAGLKTVHDFLDRAQLSHLYRGEEREQPRIAAVTPAADVTPAQTSATLVDLATADSATFGFEQFQTQGQMPDNEPLYTEHFDKVRAALEQSPEAEVICIVRPINDPRAASRVVILNRASSGFVSYLTDEMEAQDERKTVAMRVPETRTQPAAPVAQPAPRVTPQPATPQAAIPAGVQPYRRSDRTR